MSFFNNIRNILKNARNRRNQGGGLSDFRNNMNNRGLFGGNRQINPFFNNNLPRKNMLLPPSIAEAQGRNMANVGMLPSYMQPGGSGMPPVEMPTDEPISRSDIMPRQSIDPKEYAGMRNLPVMSNDSDRFKRNPFKNNIPIPQLPTAGLPSLMQPPTGMPNYMSSGQAPKQMMPMYGSGGEAESSDFPDLSGEGVIEMGNGGDPAEKTFTDYQPEGALKDSIFDYIPDAYQVSAFLQDKFSRPMPVKSDLPMIDNDADMMNHQRALQNYQEFYYSQPEAFRANLPSPAELYNEPEKVMNDPAYREIMGEAALGLGPGLMKMGIEMGAAPLGPPVQQIGTMLKDLDAPEKKSLNLPMMSR